jgi:mono/diheme cytochrome c family protein
MRRIAGRLLFSGAAMTIAAALGCTKLPPPTPLSQLNDQQMLGHDVFQQHCLQCHYDRVNQSLAGPTLRGIFKRQYLPSGAPAMDERVRSTIAFGYGIMPPMGRSMTTEEREAVLAYLHTL